MGKAKLRLQPFRCPASKRGPLSAVRCFLLAHFVPFQLPSSTVVDENLTPDTPLEDQATPPQPIERVAPPESRFLFVDIAALRAKQLRRGARPRIAAVAAEGAEPSAEQPRKPERIAMEEVRLGLVYFDMADTRQEPPAGGK
jgi:DNA-directed RNA polymerase subunit K/omega